MSGCLAPMGLAARGDRIFETFNQYTPYFLVNSTIVLTFSWRASSNQRPQSTMYPPPSTDNVDALFDAVFHLPGRSGKKNVTRSSFICSLQFLVCQQDIMPAGFHNTTSYRSNQARLIKLICQFEKDQPLGHKNRSFSFPQRLCLGI